jgi:hypothetical protein
MRMQPTNDPMGSHGEVGDLARPQETSHMDGLDLATAKIKQIPKRGIPQRACSQEGDGISRRP